MTIFFIIFLSTVVITRIFLFVKPTPSPTLKGFRIHHWMYGVVFIIFGIAVSSIIFYAIGLGLFIDELTYLLIRGKTHEDNYSSVSLIGTISFVVLVYIFKGSLMSLLF